jgi:hypothetical protein
VIDGHSHAAPERELRQPPGENDMQQMACNGVLAESR